MEYEAYSLSYSFYNVWKPWKLYLLVLKILDNCWDFPYHMSSKIDFGWPPAKLPCDIINWSNYSIRTSSTVHFHSKVILQTWSCPYFIREDDKKCLLQFSSIMQLPSSYSWDFDYVVSQSAGIIFAVKIGLFQQIGHYNLVPLPHVYR